MNLSSKPTVMTNEDLKNIYKFIKTRYIKLGIQMGNLKDIYVDEKWNCIEIDNGVIGRAFNFSGAHNVYGDLFKDFNINSIKPLVGKKMSFVIENLINSKGILARSFCLAGLNALSKNIFNSCDYNSFPSIIELVNEDTIITQIGYNPWVNTLAEKVKKVFVSDMRKKELLLKQIQDNGGSLEKIEICSPKNNREIIEKSDIIIFSGCTIVNKTYLDIIKWSEGLKAAIVFGPSAEVIPEYLFNLGITHISNSNYKICL